MTSGNSNPNHATTTAACAGLQEMANPIGAGKKLGWMDPKQKKKMAREKARLANKAAKEAKQSTLKLAKAKAKDEAGSADAKPKKPRKSIAKAKAKDTDTDKDKADSPGTKAKKSRKIKHPDKPKQPRTVSGRGSCNGAHACTACTDTRNVH